MDPRAETGPPEPGGPDVDVLRQAIGIYLEHAYPTGQIPEAVRRRLTWAETDQPGPVPFDQPPFEHTSSPGPDRPPVYSLRLGNARYPHMKLQIQPWPTPAGFLLSVNTHDQVTPPDPSSPDAEAFRALQAENQKYKQTIESAWDTAGLPTFLRYLREYIQRDQDKHGLNRPEPNEPGSEPS